MENVTRSLAGFAARLEFGVLDGDLVLRFKKYLLDAIGRGLHGAVRPFFAGDDKDRDRTVSDGFFGDAS